MSQILQQHIPKRMWPKVAHVSFYMPVKHRAKVVVLTTDHHLYEVEQKEIVFDCDLSRSILNDIALPLYSMRENQADCNSSSSNSQQSQLESEDIKFGKYYAYCDFRKRLFILVKAFDKLVAVERTETGFSFVKEYSNVDRFEVIDPAGNYHTSVAIHFQDDSNSLFENFLGACSIEEPSTSKSILKISMNESFREAQEHISQARTELAVQQIANRRQFVALKDKLMFGPDAIRSDRLEEKQQLGKYGDVWMKTVGDNLVLGIPVINNCSRRLTILQNVRAAMVFENKTSVEYECNIYQLKDDSYQFEDISELLDDSEEEQNTSLTFTKDWQAIKNKILRPETSAIVTVKMKLNNILDTIATTLRAHCFLLYDISNETHNIDSAQQYYVRTIEIDTNVLCLPEYQITFNPESAYKDLLAISVTSDLFTWTVDSKSYSIGEKLSVFIMDKFGFSRLFGSSSGTMINSRHDSTADKHTDRTELSEMFYHRPTGYNHLMGTLIRTIQKQPNRLILKVYVRDDYKALFIYNTLRREFQEQCTIHPINYNWDDCYQKTSLLNFYESLQKEVEMAIENVESVSRKIRTRKRSEFYDWQVKLYTQELRTDCILMNMNRP